MIYNQVGQVWICLFTQPPVYSESHHPEKPGKNKGNSHEANIEHPLGSKHGAIFRIQRFYIHSLCLLGSKFKGHVLGGGGVWTHITLS